MSIHPDPYAVPRLNPRSAHYTNLCMTYEGWQEEILVRTPDLSASGMFINTPRFFPEGAVLNLVFRLARSGLEIHARGEVRYCLPGIGIGVEFLDLSDTARRAIEAEGD